MIFTGSIFRARCVGLFHTNHHSCHHHSDTLWNRGGRVDDWFLTGMAVRSGDFGCFSCIILGCVFVKHRINPDSIATLGMKWNRHGEELEGILRSDNREAKFLVPPASDKRSATSFASSRALHSSRI